MSVFYRVKYVDAYYVYSSKLLKSKLKPHEARGYVIKNDQHTVVVFIKKRNKDLKINKHEIIEGLVIPTAAIGRYVAKKNLKVEKNLLSVKLKSHIAVTWLDVVYVHHQARYTCSAMYTEGVLECVEKDHIVLRNPETIRVYPNPIKNHPEKKPTFYVIPKSFIVDVLRI